MGISLEYCLLIFIASLVSAWTASGLIRVVINRASKWGVMDHPDERKIHRAPVPRMGGLGLIPGVWLGSSLALVLASHTKFFGNLGFDDNFVRMLIGFILGSFGMFFLGMIDDLRRLSAGRKLAIQVLIALIAFYFLPLPETLLGFSTPYWLSGSLILFWLILIPNSVNLLDGVDGLTGSLFLLFSLCLAVIAAIRQEFIWLMVLLPIAASTLAFLRFNWNPAKIFLGDSGSLTLGFAVAYFAIAFAITETSVFHQDWNLALSLSLTSIWLMDTVYAIIRRYVRKAPSFEIFLRRSKMTYLGLHSKAIKHVITPDRMHLHHRLIAMGFGAKQVVLVLAGFWISIVLIGSSPLLMEGNSAQLIGSHKYAVWAAFLTGAAGALILFANTYALIRRLRPEFRYQVRKLTLILKKDEKAKEKAAA